MKYIILFLFLITIPCYAFASESLASRLNGTILLAVEDHGKTYYVHEGLRYRVTQSTAHTIFEQLALGINDADLALIPEGDVGIDPEQPMCSEPVTEYITEYVTEYIECECEDLGNASVSDSDLQDELDDLQDSYTALNGNYEALQEDYNDLYDEYMGSDIWACEVSKNSYYDKWQSSEGSNLYYIEENKQLQERIEELEQFILNEL